MKKRIGFRGFTLIELLIVVAIIAILAAIAVPNFLEAQMRSKVSRAKSDMRTMATALEAYAVDFNRYPACHRFGIVLRNAPGEPAVLERLSTPVAYITQAAFRDPFMITQRYNSGSTASALVASPPVPVNPALDPVAALNSYIYQAVGPEGRSQTQTDSFAPVAFTKASAWVLHSAGPDSAYFNLGGVLANDFLIDGPILLIYDSSNGTVSLGSVFRAGGAPQPGIQAPSTPYAGGVGLIKAIDSQK